VGDGVNSSTLLRPRWAAGEGRGSARGGVGEATSRASLAPSTRPSRNWLDFFMFHHVHDVPTGNFLGDQLRRTRIESGFEPLDDEPAG